MSKMKHRPILIVVFCLTTLGYAQNNPLKNPNICGRPQCKEGSGKFKYGPGTQQNYQYSVAVRSLFNGTSQNESNIYVEGTATLDFLTPCDGLLSLSDLKLTEIIPKDGQEPPEHPNSQQFAEILGENSLRFSFNDGIITELCPSEEEKNWVLNFKRGILSMFHNTMKRFDLDHNVEEVDVRGKCSTSYKVKGAKETSLIIEKTKDLSSCQSRSKLHSIVQSRPYTYHSKLNQDNSILKSRGSCELSIDHNIYNKIVCKESHLLQPFSKQEAGALTTIEQTLVLINEVSNTLGEEAEITRRTSLYFDHSPTPKPTHGELKSSRDLIKQLCKKGREDIQIEFSDIFNTFIHTLRALSYPAFQAIYEHAAVTCSTGRRHILDALPFVGSSASVGVMKDIILKGNIPESTLNEWMMSMAFIARPDEDMVQAASELLQSKRFHPNIALSVAALTHTYCTLHSDCHLNADVDSIVQYLQNNIRGNIRGDKIDTEVHNEIMVALKGISNIGVITEDFQEELFFIIKNPTFDVTMRVAAVEAFRRLPCDERQNNFEEIFRDMDEDSEVRIASYLQIMRCPNYLLVKTLRHSLENEEVNQVGSFVWSHLNNLLKTANPAKIEVQTLLSDADLTNKFSTDVRKFSRNFEGSMNFDEYGVGANYESNIIFSPSSYIPRSAMLNLTVDLFGESVNLLEVYGRAEGFEHYFESLFGPRGSSNDIKEKIPKMRWTRNTDESEVLKSEVEKLPNVMENSFGEPKVSLGFKVFGNELKYNTFNGDEEIRDALRTLNPVDHLKRILSGKEINYNKAVMFLDSDYIVPSSAGLPISLSAVGAASINLRLSGSLHAAAFVKTKELDLTADIQPTVSVDITGTMSVDAYFANTGIKLKTNMYTASAIKGSIKIRGTKLVNIQFSLPKQNTEIFGVRSELFIKKNNVEESQSGLSTNLVSKSICSWPAVDKTVGLKLCADYHFIDVTQINNTAYFLLAGPSGFRWYLSKSDPTAKTYLFEYKWTQAKDLSVIHLTFDTPGSNIKRLLSANFTIDRQSRNLTMFIQSSAGTVLARGKYKNTDAEKYLQVALDVNNKKHFDASVSLLKKPMLNGFSYQPKVYLGVNGERVLELQGSVELISKKDVSQYSVDLKFETKRLVSTLFGYITKTDNSLASDLSLDYKFLHTKGQRVTFDFSVANRSKKNLAVVQGNANLFTTAYPKFNFNSNITFRRSGSHIECKTILHQSPLPSNHSEAEYRTLKFDWLFSYKAYADSKRVLDTSLSIKRKSTNLDLKGTFSYQTRGPDINLATLVKYGNNKQVSISLFWSRPRTTLEQIKTYLNITVPSFQPMILRLDLQERQPGDFEVNISGTWFSGHNMIVRGYYQDKSTALSSNHHVKLFLKSPNFKDINIDLQFYRDNDVLKLDLKGNHDNNEYLLYFDNTVISAQETKTHVEIKYKTKLYTMSSSVYVGDYRKITVELRIDQLRDIRFSIWGYNQDAYKAAGLELNWDANRDPNKKILIAANFTKVASFNYNADLIIGYPTRTIIGKFEFLLERGKIDTLTSLSWDDEKTLAIDLVVNYDNYKGLYFDVASKIKTPFEEWKVLRFDSMFNHTLNSYEAEGTISWNNRQKIYLAYLSNYVVTRALYDYKFLFNFTSSLDNFPSLSTRLHHSWNDSSVNTDVHLKYNPKFFVNLSSKWHMDSNDQFTNLTGTILSESPFDGFKKGVMVSKICLSNEKYIRGVADVDLDHKKVTIDVEGKFKKITDSMLVVNVTTPDEFYQGRFLLSEEKRHLVALLTYPSGSYGTEILFQVHAIYRFNIKFFLATPMEYLQRILVVAKLQPEEADFRLGWNLLLLGFRGVWHYANVTDFEYSYKIYTPIEDFEENGIVAKLKFKEGLDFEVSAKLSKHKLGLKLLGQSKPKTLKELGIQMGTIYGAASDDDYEEDDDEDDESDDPLSWAGLIEVDAITYPTMKGKLEIDQKGPAYILQGKLFLPHGLATIINEFEYLSVFAIKNELVLTTPYQSFKKLISNFNLNIKPGNQYLLGLNFDYQNQTREIKTGLFAQYTQETKDEIEKSYNVTLKVNTPFEVFPKLNALAILDIEENFYRTKLLVDTNRSDISMDATSETENGIMDLTAHFHARTPSISIPPCVLVIQKNFSANDRTVEINFHIPDRLKSEVFIKASWMFESPKKFHTIFQLETPFRGMENTSLGLRVSLLPDKSTIWGYLNMNPILIETNSTLISDQLKMYTNLNLNGKEIPVTLVCKILRISPTKIDLDGTLTINDKPFIVTGHIAFIQSLPIKTVINLVPQDGSPPVNFEYVIRPASEGYELIGSIRHSQKFTQFTAHANASGKFDWELHLQVKLSHQQDYKLIMDAKATSTDNSRNIVIDAVTPIPKLEHPKLGASLTSFGDRQQAQGYFEVSEASGSINVDWVWLFLENMFVKIIGHYENKQYSSDSSLIAFYENPNKAFSFLKVGGDIKVDELWEAGSNVTLSLPSNENINVEGHIKPPASNKDTHSLYGKLRTSEKLKNIEYLAKYRTNYSNRKYGTWGDISLSNRTNIGGNVEVELDSKRYNNYLNINTESAINVLYKLSTPKFVDKNHFVANMIYRGQGSSHNLTCMAFSPENQSIAYGTVDYETLANMNGMVNITVPYSINYTGAYFTTKTNAQVYNRYIKVFWANDNAIVDEKCNIRTGSTLLERYTDGKLTIEVPLATRHVAHIDFTYNEKPRLSTGHATVNYNGSQVLEAKYNCLSEEKAGSSKDTIHVELQNKMVPVGADYVHGYEYDAPRDGYNLPTVDSKYLHLYHLTNQSKLNLTGALNVKSTPTGQEYIFKAIHLNRTVKLWTDYDVLDQEYRQHSRLELSPSTWIEYDLNLLNKTVDETFDAQQVQINVLYPLRNFTALGSYNISDSIVSTDISLMWDKDRKSVQAGLDWKRTSIHREQVIFQVKHPSFERDVSFLTEYGYNKSMMDAQLTVNYALNPDQTLTLGGAVSDNSDQSTYNYTYNMWAEHNATNLNLKTWGDFYWNAYGYGTEHFTNYKRSYLPLLTAERLARVNLTHNEIELKENSVSGLSYLWGRYDGKFPVYTANISAIHGINDASGEFCLNLTKKLLYLDLNMTKDGSQSLHMYGVIPDARSARFGIWRDYEDIRVSDVSYYLRLNHSRLIMSRLEWRPNLISDIKSGLREQVHQLYTELLESINNTKQYVRAETLDAIYGIWQDSKPMTRQFVNDLRNLSVIEADFEEFKKFLNTSYYANEFYIKDISNIIMTMFDELALKSHLQSLPKIVQEIWQIMGSSGAKIRKSITWVIEKIKIYYKHTTEFIRGLLNGDPVEHLSEVLRQFVEKYDELIKNIHVAVLQYLEQLWAQSYALIVDNWYKTLAALEPTFLKFIHYLETIVWNTSKEFLDFLYIRKNEIIESPYFVQLANFSHDFDKFYKDITGKHTLASIYKYYQLAWKFFEEKYLESIPFGKELREIYNEIITELGHLAEIPLIKFWIDKYSEAYSYIKYYYDNFEVEEKVHRILHIIYVKISDMYVTALEVENRNRVPKTKFIFEPLDGIMLLEQKLPMSWQAFNETPKFQEIPEIKTLYDIQNYFAKSQASFWSFYYDYKPYTDPTEWLPPFKGQAMLIGSKHYVTFDRRYYDFKGSCTYLLATDFLDKNFTIFVSYDGSGLTNELVLLLNNTVVHINVFTNNVKISNSATDRLPFQIGDTYMYRDADIITMKNSEFILECNVKFHICMFELSGWHFGKTAGLWGTLNNEAADDLLTSSKTKAKISQVDQFAHSWVLDGSCKPDHAHDFKIGETAPEISEMCNEFYNAKVSQLSTCFSRVNKEPFLRMCMNSTTKEEACTSAIAYTHLCASENTPLRIPDTCVKCNLQNGTEIKEGDFVRLEGNDVPKIADIVFIVEAKMCNTNLRTLRILDTVIQSIEKEVSAANVSNTRYSLVVFGGSGVFDEPRSVVLNGDTFTNSRGFVSYFNDIPTGNGSTDIFNAIIFANKLHFRPGSSRNFILIPCSECQEYNMEHDYSIIHQLLFENGVALHILMDEYFSLQKDRESKTVFGVDLTYAYTRKDANGLTKDKAQRKPISLPKTILGYCTSLALETRGSVFSGKYLESDKRDSKKRNAEKFATVFGKRVALSAVPTLCMDCECTAPNTGVSYMECYPCTYPTRANIEHITVY